MVVDCMRRDHLVGLHDGQIRFVDESLMKVIEFLREEDLFDDTVLFITSDHGEEFWDHGNFEHGHSLYEELIHIPMIVAGGGVKSGRADSGIGLLDLTPTLVDLAGLPPGNHDFAGRSFSDILRGHERAGPGTPLFAMGTLYGRERYCLIDGDLKIILNTSNDTGKMDLVGHGALAADIPAHPVIGQGQEPQSRAGQNQVDSLRRECGYARQNQVLRNEAGICTHRQAMGRTQHSRPVLMPGLSAIGTWTLCHSRLSSRSCSGRSRPSRPARPARRNRTDCRLPLCRACP